MSAKREQRSGWPERDSDLPKGRQMDIEKDNLSIEDLRFDEKGLIPCIAQDVEDGEVMRCRGWSSFATTAMPTACLRAWSRQALLAIPVSAPASTAASKARPKRGHVRARLRASLFCCTIYGRGAPAQT